MNPLDNPSYLLPPLVAAALNGALLSLVLRRAQKNPGRDYFALFLLSVGIWSLLVFFLRSSSNPDRALLWERAILPFILGSPAAFYLFARAYAGTRTELPARKPATDYLVWAYVLAAVVLAATGLLVDSMTPGRYGYSPRWNPVFYPFAAIGYVLMAVGIANLFRAYRRAPVYEERNRFLLVGLATAFPVAGTVVDLFPETYPSSILGMVAFGTVTTVALLRYHLLDISVAIRKGLAYLLVSVLVAAPYVSVLLLATHSLQGSQFQPAVYVFVVLLLSLSLQPLWNRVQAAVDKTFFRSRWDRLRTLEEFIQRTRDITQLEAPAAELVDMVKGAVQADGAALLLPSETGEFAPVAALGRPDVGTLRIRKESPLITFLERQGAPLEQRQLDLDPQLQALTDRDRMSLVQAGAQVLVPLRIGQRVTGVLALGSKLAETPYSKEEFTLLSLIATQAAVLLNNALLYQSIASQLEQGRRRLEAFQSSATKLALEQDAERALHDLVDTARTLVEAGYTSLSLYSAEGRLERSVTSGHGDGQSSGNGWQPEGAAFQANGGAAVSSTQIERGRNAMSVPVFRKGRFLGTLLVKGKQGGPDFSADDERILKLFAVLVQVLLENIGLYQEVEQERGTLAAIQSSMAEGLIVLDAKGAVLYLNPAATSLLEVSSTEVIGKSLKEALTSRAADAQALDGLARLLHPVKGKEKTATAEVVVQAKSGRREVVLTAFPISVPQTITGVLLRDVSQERELERRRDAFVSAASHELRTPLTTILGFSELLLKRNVSDEARRRWLTSIHEDSARLSAIVDDLLDASRIRSGMLRVNLKPCSITTVIEAEAARLRTTTEAHQIDMQLPPDLPEVIADREKLAEVMINLLNNAIKYSPAGGRITVTACLESERQRVLVSVADEGMGIALEDQAALFTRFHRITRPETVGIRGTGLGLYIVKSYLEAMRGEVWVQSAVGKGSTFFFAVPVASTDATPESADASAKGATGAGHGHAH